MFSRIIMILPYFLLLGHAAADSGDDFSNNLFTDLSPLLALFGERVTMQFLSQAMGLSDCIILAMAPLGIITIIVAAIRVGGPSWLKALIGRATENIAAAELELMSSTSNEVCELWNGNDVVRCAGSASVWEFICLLPMEGKLPQNPKVEIMDLKKAKESYMSELKATNSLRQIFKDNPIDRLRQLYKTKPVEDTENGNAQSDAPSSNNPDIIILRNSEHPVPNISHNRYKNTGRSELYLAACFAVLLQIGVLIYCGIITQLSGIKSRFQKDGNPVGSYAFPLTIIGTVVLNIGMLVCCRVVETSTKEISFRPKEKWRARMVWLQREKTVGDQEFKSFALWTGEDQPIIITSSRKDEKEISQKNILELITVVGTITSLIGFFAQFIGIRGMHWSVSVASLIAVLLMTAVRAWIRRGLTKPVYFQHLQPGFELDWFANTLENIDEAPWYKKQNGSENERRSSTTPAAKPGEIQKCTQRRQDLANLAGYQGPASKEAEAVRLATEGMMNLLYKDREKKEFSWYYDVQGSQKIEDKIQFKIARLNDGKWTANMAQIEAALSLRLFHINREEKIEPPANNTYSSSDNKERIPIKGETRIRVLGPNTTKLLRHLNWWVPADGPQIRIGRVGYILPKRSQIDDSGNIQVNDTSRMATGSTGFNIHQSTVVWLDPEMRHSIISSPGSEVILEEEDILKDSDPAAGVEGSGTTENRQTSNSGRSEEGGEPLRYFKAPKADSGLLLIKSRDSLQNLYAKDMFSTFMWDMMNSLEYPIKGNTDIQVAQVIWDNEEDTWRSLSLRNDDITRSAQTIQDSGLCNLHEAYISVISPLCIQQKLPELDCIIELVRNQTRELEARHSWKDAGEVYLQLSRHLHVFEVESYTYIRAIAALVAFRKALQKENSEPDLAQRLMEPADKNLGHNLNLLCEFQNTHDGFRLVSYHQDIFSLAERYRDLREDYSVQRQHRAEDEAKDEAKEAKAKDIFDRTPLHYCAVFSHHLMFGPKNRTGDEDSLEEGIYKLYLKRTRQLIDNGIDINGRDIRGWTPLHYACHIGKTSIHVARLLLEKGASADVRGRDGTAPIHCAAIEGHFEMVKLLLKFGANIDILDGSGSTALHAAALKGFAEIFQLLCSRSRITRDRQGRTAFHMAAMVGFTAAIEDWVGKRHHRDGDVKSKDQDVKSKDQDVKSKDQDVNSKDQNVNSKDQNVNSKEQDVNSKEQDVNSKEQDVNSKEQDVDSKEQDVDSKEQDINSKEQDVDSKEQDVDSKEQDVDSKDRDVNSEDRDVDSKDYDEKTPLHYAVEFGRKEFVQKLLVLPQVNINATAGIEKSSVLHIACEKGHDEIVEILLKEGSDIEAVNIEDETPLLHAIRNQRQSTVELLTARGAELATVLEVAARRGDTAIFQYLVSKQGKDVVHTGANTIQGAPLHCASGGIDGNPLIQHLINWGANVDETDADGMTPLHRAVSRNKSANIQLLVKMGAIKEARDWYGRTPLQLAAQYYSDPAERQECIRLLIGLHVKVNTANLWGRTVLHDVAANISLVGLIPELLDAGARIEDTDFRGSTALHRAAGARCVEGIKALIEGGASVEAVNRSGQTPRSIIEEWGGTYWLKENTPPFRDWWRVAILPDGS